MDAILEAAAQLFAQEGLAATTNRIADRAGYSIGTLYQYFPNKQALLYALAQRHVEVAWRELDATFAALRRDRPDWPEWVDAVLGTLVDLHRHQPGLHALMYEYAPRMPAGVARLRELRERVVAEVTAELIRCGRGGPDPRHTAAMLVHAADAQLHLVLLGRGDAEALNAAVLGANW